jgi:hypothetical protein
LKLKFNSYFSEFKLCNKDRIEKNKVIGNNIDEIKEAFLSYIQEEEIRNIGTFDNQTFGHKISPATENLIIDLVLETEKYIESIMESVKKYQIEEGIKKKILEAIAKSTSKESVAKNISELGKIGDFKMKSLQEETVDKTLYSKIMSKVNKAYNKYYGYRNISKKEIDEIAEYAYKRLKETDKEKS